MSPDTVRSMVVLPAPLAPTTATTSPAPTASVTEWSARRSPWPASTPDSSSSDGPRLVVEFMLGAAMVGQRAAERETQCRMCRRTT